MADRKNLSLKEFVELGLLQEVNRQILHPLGVALAVIVNPDGSVEFDGVWDYREHADGMVFDEVDVLKAKRVEALLQERASARMDSLGYIVQPLGPAGVEPPKEC